MDFRPTPKDLGILASSTYNDPAVRKSYAEVYRLLRQKGFGDERARRQALAKRKQVYQDVFCKKAGQFYADRQFIGAWGLAEDQRTDRTPKYATKSGDRVRSKIEKIIGDFLTDHQVRYVYEPDLNLGGFHVHPDFYLVDHGVCLEHFGLNHQRYLRAAKSKLRRYRQFEIPVVVTYLSDEPDIEAALTRKLCRYGVFLQSKKERRC